MLFPVQTLSKLLNQCKGILTTNAREQQFEWGSLTHAFVQS